MSTVVIVYSYVLMLCAVQRARQLSGSIQIRPSYLCIAHAGSHADIIDTP